MIYDTQETLLLKRDRKVISNWIYVILAAATSLKFKLNYALKLGQGHTTYSLRIPIDHTLIIKRKGTLKHKYSTNNEIV